MWVNMHFIRVGGGCGDESARIEIPCAHGAGFGANRGGMVTGSFIDDWGMKGDDRCGGPLTCPLLCLAPSLAARGAAARSRADWPQTRCPSLRRACRFLPCFVHVVSGQPHGLEQIGPTLPLFLHLAALLRGLLLYIHRILEHTVILG